MVQSDYVVKILVLTLLIFYSTNGFNLSPKPNYIFREPNLRVNKSKSQSSYFGLTINLRTSSVIVGAPRAQSTLSSQQTLNETGAIYKCTIATGTCAPFVFDDTGNINDDYNAYTYDSEKKDHQWLGASMDGGPKDTDKLVVCAPRLMANSATIIDYLMHGICYWTPDTLSDIPLRVKEIAPLRFQTEQIKQKNGKSYFYYMFGEQGLSAHVTSNNEEIIIGAPGIHMWKGSIIRYHPKSDDDNIRMSRRDLENHRVVRQTQKIKYTAEVLNPDTWKQENDSYFGYSVGSGYFDSDLPNKIYYVASAPQANHQSGEVYIFDIIKDNNGRDSIKKLNVFHGSQFGEYFGYAVLAEDFNGDGLTDLIVTAPQYSSDELVDQGAMYVFINKGRFVFELQKIIKSPVEGIGRFGSAISKLGDINHDGFNDIAVGAPFAENGTVLIYLGSSKGLREVSSQQLSPGPIATSWGSSPMFGHGLSKGADIDNNGFNDLAIGVPNAESVFVYRAYPVVKIHATINSRNREIKHDQKEFQIQICYRISTTSPNVQSQDLAIRVNVDPKVKRVTLVQTKSAELTFNAGALLENQCRSLNASVKFSTADIFKTIELEIHYDLINGVPDSEDFCDKCAAVDPAEPKYIREKLIFGTGCKAYICLPDLKVKSSGLKPTFILGSSRTISVTYEVTNSGEKAYLPRINIESSNKMPFNKKPAFCDQHADVLWCDLNRGQPMLDEKQSITIVYDASQIEGSSIILTANVSSAGNEQNLSDNVVRDFISLREFTEIEAIGKPYTPHINLEKVFNSAEIINNYDVKSSGPSKIQELEIAFDIPIAHKFYGSTKPVPVIDVNNITIQGVYNSQLLYVELYQDKTLMLVNPTEISMSSTRTIVTENGNQIIYQPPKINSVELGKDAEKLYAAGVHRRRRSTEQVAPNNEFIIKAAQKKSHELLTEELKGFLPINRTIVFSCIDSETTTCVRAVMKVNNFIPDTPITVTLKYHVDLNEVNKIVIEPWEFFVIITKLDIIKIGDLDGKSTHIRRKVECNVISKHQLYGTPWWVIVLAIFGGLLILAAIAYGMHKSGFFRRKLKEEMDKLIQEQQEAEESKDES